jgi:predicted enzyme related to lactoylglutathione lyase
MADGEVNWFEFDYPKASTDQAKQFYGTVFSDWKLAPFEGMPDYVIINVADKGIGALQGSDDPQPAGRHMTNYILVGDLEGTLGKVSSNGGKVLQERMEVPGPQWIGIFEDPFGLKVGVVTNNAKG